LALEKVVAVHSLDHSQYFLPQVSRTFHGRDVFAPVAAHLANRLPVAKLGWKLPNYVRLPWPEPKLQDSGIVGEVLYVDHFGNAITNLDTASLADTIVRKQVEVLLGRKRVASLSSCYASVPKGKPVAVIGSSGFLEIAVNGGNAAQSLKIQVGTPVTVR
jgi:S-adenosylmethionine hydrolase